MLSSIKGKMKWKVQAEKCVPKGIYEDVLLVVRGKKN